MDKVILDFRIMAPTTIRDYAFAIRNLWEFDNRWEKAITQVLEGYPEEEKRYWDATPLTFDWKLGFMDKCAHTFLQQNAIPLPSEGDEIQTYLQSSSCGNFFLVAVSIGIIACWNNATPEVREILEAHAKKGEGMDAVTIISFMVLASLLRHLGHPATALKLSEKGLLLYLKSLGGTYEVFNLKKRRF